ncbi:Alpha/beta hydrolase [Modestobacter italicus]|uniref:Alpha/beta hydrolase n=1 Tax=Modestobacter italicus (strain DSM 44449 / CECT 9708 / BC 501) TaxID=2732864 RepID=I4EVP0_MODI5|nr:alpha/beta hydrolase [Modestobacter marinus]CCH87453.1 Alpha/beta hydrolase [Modestobacter marinus]
MTDANVVAPTTPTVALVHGAFADSSGWVGVIDLLRAAGIDAVAVSNPLRGIAEDSAYVASALAQLPGPVLAVGHSYGGAIITNAAARAGNVVGLVYVSAFAPDEGEKLIEVEAGSTDSVLDTALVERQYPTGQGGETVAEFSIDPARFHQVFAADLTEEQAADMAATQRPVSSLGFVEPNGPPAWKTLPSWAVVSTGDTAAGADVVRRMAQRAGAVITETEGSHVLFIARPQVVADVIVQALSALSQGAAAPAAAGV